MRRFVVIPAVLLLFAAVMPAAASAQSAPDERARFTDEFVEENFCGTGESVQVVENTVANVWGLEGEDTFKLTFRSKVTLTYGDRTLVEIDAGRVDVQRVEGTYPGPRTAFVIETGLRAALRLPGGGMLTLDHGYLEYLASFDENGDFLGVETLKEAGGHPVFEEGVFCEIAVEALEIPTS